MKPSPAQLRAMQRMAAMASRLTPRDAIGISTATLRAMRARGWCEGTWLIGWALTDAGRAAACGSKEPT